MSEQQWEVIDSVSGEIQAELLRGLLESLGIPAYLSQEGLGHFGYVVTVGALGKIDILVPALKAEEARHVLDAYYSGEYTLKDEGEQPPAEDEDAEEDAKDKPA